MQKLLYLSNQPANIYIQKLPVCFPTIVLTCCFNTRFFTPSITNCDRSCKPRSKESSELKHSVSWGWSWRRLNSTEEAAAGLPGHGESGRGRPGLAGWWSAWMSHPLTGAPQLPDGQLVHTLGSI